MKRAVSVLLVLALLAALLTFAGASPALAHADLVKAEFAGGVGGGTHPRSLVLHFSEAIDPHFSSARVVDQSGRVVEPGPGTLGPADPVRLTVDISALPLGTYTAEIRVRSTDDGHVTDTTLPFMLGRDVNTIGGLPPLGTVDPALRPPPVLESVARWLGLVGLALLGGTVVFELGLRHGKRASLPRSSLAIAFWGVGLIAFGAVLLLVSQAAATTTLFTGAFDRPLARELATRSGTILLARIALALLAAGLTGVLARPSSSKAKSSLQAVALGLLTAGVVLTFGLVGHAAATSHPALSAALDWVHTAAMAAWLGGLLPLLLLVSRPFRLAPAPANAPRTTNVEGDVGHDGTVARHAVPELTRFSILALGCVAVLLATGVYAFVLDVRHPGLFFSTTCGRVLLAKLVLVAILIGFGGLNRSAIIPRLTAGGPAAAARARRHFKWSLLSEIGVGALLLVTVAVMTALPTSAGVWPEHQRLEPMQATEVSGVDLLLRVSPGEVGPNSIAVDVSDRRPGTRNAPGTVSLSVVGSLSSSSTPASERTPRGLERYSLVGYPLESPGPTRFQVTLSRPGQKTVQAVLTLPIAPGRH